ncbi:MAG: hypothetical protein HY302_08550 [Opitutae bacterium]|nr:hypothetical protein [Opitutae bacterium]
MRNPTRLVLVCALAATGIVHLSAQLGVTVSAGGRNPATASLIVASASESIRACAFEARNQMLFDLETRLKTAKERIEELLSAGKALADEKKGEFESAAHDLRVQEAALRLGMQAAEKSSAADWPRVRAALAFSYVDYVGVVTRLENLVAGRT